MYSDKENIAILTSLLKAHGVDSAVVCPGSRNGAITSNFAQARIKCHSVNDERSAAFVALGLCQATRKPVAVVVTSGSAVLNLLPAVAEASFRNYPLVIISADRPVSSIGQLEGQTIPQPGAFHPYASMCVSLPEPHDDESRIFCNRLVNEAMIECKRAPGHVVHINVPVSEPLFLFNRQELPRERVIQDITSPAPSCADRVYTRIREAKRPMVILGQCEKSPVVDRAMETLRKYVTVLSEPLSCASAPCRFNEVLERNPDDRKLMPDFVLYVGGHIVGKRLITYLRNADDVQVWGVNPDGRVQDTFRKQRAVVKGEPDELLKGLAVLLRDGEPLSGQASEFKTRWDSALAEVDSEIASEELVYSERLIVKRFENMIRGMSVDCSIHYANSSAVRLACIYSRHYIYVNRGVNGIEGSLSAAAGYSLEGGLTFCVIGDLSFFYDCNALWNKEINGNLRILLLNNHGGSIFKTLKGLSPETAAIDAISGAHSANAAGVCESFGVDHMQIADASKLDDALRWLAAPSQRPRLLEALF